MALKDIWQQERQRRQQGLRARQQRVATTRDTNRQSHAKMASKIQQELADIRSNLAQDDQLRRLEFQCFQAGLQADQQQRQDDVQEMLATLCDRRQAEAQQSAIDRSLFVTQLQAQTADFLNQAAVARQQMAAELQTNLQNCRAALQSSNQELRQTLRADLDLLKAEVEATLQDYALNRQAMGQALRQDLLASVDRLQSDVAQLLSDYAEQRQVRSIDLAAQLQTAREDRQAEMAELFQDLADFRQSLARSVQDLKRSVWGDGTSQPETLRQEEAVAAMIEIDPTPAIVLQSAKTPSMQAQPVKTQSIKTQPVKTQPVKTQAPSQTRPAVASKPSKVPTSQAPASGKQRSPQKSEKSATSTPATPVPAMPLAQGPQEALPIEQVLTDLLMMARSDTPVNAESVKELLQSVDQTLTAKVVQTASSEAAVLEPSSAQTAEPQSRSTAKTQASPATSMEMQMLHLIQQSEGVRLSDLESTLEMSRADAVSTLTRLIREGHVIQRDRLYMAR
ncbi:hypothetical protein [Alkalinema sp. FACHB-956]|uniref:hypothetical protein n=1 Tax=Alkalinema sp. FACHB-956 TaxID=2692768 RepID=UPI001686186C|nr:hypothetical protein [Alkalinema sp. FACHB-956]MBD2329414.1 hypothetical protein [Alkalinema sp. FACHB-956]